MMIKFFLGIVIIAFTSLCGHLLAKKYRLRKDFFKQFKEFNERFLNEISYYRRPIQEFIGAYSYRGAFQDLLNHYCVSLRGSDYSAEIASQLAAYDFLTEEEKRTVEDYFLMLGKGDSASQKTYFSSVKEGISTLYAEAESAAKRYGDLYIKIGFLCGLLILILIV